MKALFNGDCVGCGLHRPRCATVHLRVPGTVARFQIATSTLCDVCRRGDWRGRFRLDIKHRSGRKE